MWFRRKDIKDVLEEFFWKAGRITELYAPSYSDLCREKVKLIHDTARKIRKAK